MIDADIKLRYQRACELAGPSILRHPQLTMAEQLRQLADSIEPQEQRDVYGKGSLIEQFEQEVARRLGKEAAIFLPTGTLAQPLALKLHSLERARQRVAMHPTSHLLLHEHMGIKALWQLDSCTVGASDQPIDISDLQSLNGDSLAAIVLELPMREIGGQLPTWQSLIQQHQWAKQHGVRLHLDGARLWQAPAHYQKSLAEIAALFDSVYVSFYKDLGGISGAVLAADRDFIEQARIWARRAGGNPISLYPEIVAARQGLKDNLPVMKDAVHYAVGLGTQLQKMDGVKVTPNPPQAAMFHLHFPLSPNCLAAKIADYIQAHGVMILPLPRAGDEHHSVCEISIGRNALSQPQDFWLRHIRAFIQSLNDQ